MNKLVILENDATLDGKFFVNKFRRDYTGEVVELTRLHSRGNSEIFAAVSTCTDIVVQTCFVNGSDSQLFDMVELLRNVKNPINIYIALLGHNTSLQNYLCDVLTVKEILSIKHHNIFEIEGFENKKLPVSFETVLVPYYKEQSKKMVHNLWIEFYKETAKNRPTGKKVKILACMANSEAFKGLPIGEIVDTYECDKLCKFAPRGVWVWGNGEPVMLVNDTDIKEYEIQDLDKLSSEEILIEICKITAFNLSTLKRVEIEGLLRIIEGDESSLIKANIICEETGIPKRSNRVKIDDLLRKCLVVQNI